MSNPVNEFLKTAGLGGALKRGLLLEALEGAAKPTSAEKLVNRAGTMATTGAIGAGLLAGAHGVMKGVDKGVHAISSAFSHPAQYEAMMQAHPSLKEEDPNDVAAVYKSVRHLSPTMAADPLVAGSLVRNILANRTEQGIIVPPDTAKLMAEVENKVKSMKGPGINPFAAEFGRQMGAPMPKQRDPMMTEEQITNFGPEGHEMGSTLKTYKYGE